MCFLLRARTRIDALPNGTLVVEEEATTPGSGSDCASTGGGFCIDLLNRSVPLAAAAKNRGTICVTGTITLCKDRVGMEVSGPAQIEELPRTP